MLRSRRTFRKFNSLPWTKDNCRFSLSSVPLFLVSSSSVGSSYLASAKASSVGSNGWSDSAASATTRSGVAGPVATRSVCRSRRSGTGTANDEKQQQHRANQTIVVTVVSIVPPAVEIRCSRWFSRCVTKAKPATFSIRGHGRRYSYGVTDVFRFEFSDGDDENGPPREYFLG